MKKLSLDQILGIFRHVMTIVGTLLAASGSVTDGSWQIVTGSAVALVSVLWSVLSKDSGAE